MTVLYSTAFSKNCHRAAHAPLEPIRRMTLPGTLFDGGLTTNFPMCRRDRFQDSTIRFLRIEYDRPVFGQWAIRAHQTEVVGPATVGLP